MNMTGFELERYTDDPSLDLLLIRRRYWTSNEDKAMIMTPSTASKSRPHSEKSSDVKNRYQ